MINRRTFVQLGSTAALATLTSQARAAEPLKPLPTTNPQAQALDYVEDVSVATDAPDSYPAGSGQDCANCLHYKAVDDEWGSCALFPGYKVRADGWCTAWVEQAGQ